METVIKITTISRQEVQVIPIDRFPNLVLETSVTRAIQEITGILRTKVTQTKILQ